ncbi:hypothetical protein Tco_0795046 [Tanacetum coccineum]
MDMEHGSEKMKSPEKIEEEDVDTQKEMKEVVKESGAKRKKSLPRKRRTVKRQKLEEDAEKEELKGFLDIIPREDVAEDVESLSTKYPIVDWKTYTLTENFMYYQIFRGDGSSKNSIRLVKERYSASRPEGYDLMLWGDLHTLFEPDEEDEIWKNQHEYNVISWSLYDFCGIHILLMQNGIAIHMLTEKKYPLSQETITKMLNKRLEVDHESSQAFELLSHEVVMEKDSKIYKGKKERVKSISLKAKKESSDDETSTSGSDDEEYAMAVRNFKKFFRRKGKFVRKPREEKKSFRQKIKRLSLRILSDSENDAEDKTNDETCLMAQSSNEATLNSSYYSDNTSSLDSDTMQIEYDSLCEISLKIINKNKILKTKRDILEKEILELNEKIKKLKRSKEIDIACKLCQELKLENVRLKETQVKFVKFDKSANSLRDMLHNQKSSSCKIGLGFDSSKASTRGTKPISFVGSSVENATDGSIIKVHGSTIPGSVSRTVAKNMTEHVFSPPMSSRLDFVITRKKLINNRIDESKKPSLKP